LRIAPQPKPPGGVPELMINSSDPTATAKALATLIAKRNDFLFNGYAPIRIADEAGWLPRALEVATEMVRVLAHEICTPTRVRTTKGVAERIPVPLSKDIAQLYLHGLEGSWGLKPFCIAVPAGTPPKGTAPLGAADSFCRGRKYKV
jgi:hypothetical protein